MASRPTRSRDRVPLGEKTAASLGGITETLSSHAIRHLAAPILNIGLGLSPVLVGVGLALPRLSGAVIDLWIGHRSDNARSRYGRRRPFMLAGAVLAGVAFGALWWLRPGQALSHYFWRFLLGSAAFSAAASLFVVPWEALLVEMSADYNERTRVQAFRSVAATFGALCLPWLFPATQFGRFGGSILGVRWVGCGVGLLMAVCGAAAALGVREPPPLHEPRRARGLISGLKTACRNRPFLVVVLMMVLYGPGLMLTEGLSLYVNIFYVFGGNIAAGTLWQGFQGTLLYGAKFLWIPVMTAVAVRIGKRRALRLCFGLSFASDILKWFCYSPAHPALQLLIPLVQSPGMGPAWVLMASMLADTTDLGASQAGGRHVGVLMAIAQWVQRAGVTAAFALSGLILAATGFAIRHDMAHSSGVLLHLRLLVCLVPAACTALAFVLIGFYPLTAAEASWMKPAAAEPRCPAAPKGA